MNIYSNYFNNFNGAIIPHAGIQYAGNARKLIFDNLNNTDLSVKYIIYLAALHDPSNSNDKVFVLENDTIFNDFFIKNKTNYILNNSEFTNGANNEYSFKWVQSEFKKYFKNAKILVLCPTPYSDLKKLANDIIYFINNTDDKVLLFATTDLTHYGKRFNNLDLLKYPQQYNKWKKEENLIDDLINNNININNQNLDIICGPFAIKTFIYVSTFFNWNGKVIDYYDSSNYNSSLIDKYSIDFDNNYQEFVSYVSIIYGSFNNDILLPIDIILAIGLIKTIINSQLVNYNDEIYLPKWSLFNKMNTGIFVGTELIKNNKYLTNSSYGNFQSENNNTNSLIKITNASKNCLNDSINRWNIPITINNLKNHIFKIEILDDINNWIEYKSSTALKNFIFDGKHGMLLTLNNGNSATFLPVVANDNKNKWSIEDYMNYLSLKAGGNINDWKHKDSTMKIYNSISFKYIPTNNSIISI